MPPPRRFPFANAVSLACDDKVLQQEQREAPRGVLARAAAWISRNAAEGLVSRQEIVSAVPVAMLDVQPGHSVLDLCASPGSKTLQALELATGGPDVKGAVIANELSARRAHILVHRCRRVGASCAGLAVTQHKAQTFPGPGRFDRIVCDVPCSGPPLSCTCVSLVWSGLTCSASSHVQQPLPFFCWWVGW